MDSVTASAASTGNSEFCLLYGLLQDRFPLTIGFKGLPTNFRKESNPFASLTTIVQQRYVTGPGLCSFSPSSLRTRVADDGARDSPPQELLPSVQDLEVYLQRSRAGQQASKTELQPGAWNESAADLPYRGPPTPDIVTSTTNLVRTEEVAL